MTPHVWDVVRLRMRTKRSLCRRCGAGRFTFNGSHFYRVGGGPQVRLTRVKPQCSGPLL